MEPLPALSIREWPGAACYPANVTGKTIAGWSRGGVWYRRASCPRAIDRDSGGSPCPAQPLRPDPLDGELAEPPPSDLSEYESDDSDTERYEPTGAGDGLPSTPPAAADSPRCIEDAHKLMEILVDKKLVNEAELRAVCAGLFPSGRPVDFPCLAAELVRRRKLTPYQVAAVRQGKIRGLVIGEYIVLDKIGAGGMGIIFKARHSRFERDVALKLLPPSISRDRAAVMRFRRESAAVSSLRHPNIVSALDAGETHGLLFLVMELVDGMDLSRLVKEKGPLAVPGPSIACSRPPAA